METCSDCDHTEKEHGELEAKAELEWDAHKEECPKTDHEDC